MNKHVEHQHQLDPSWFDGFFEIALDTETTGLDYHVSKVILMSFARPDGETLTIDTRTVNIEPLRPILEDPARTWIGQNMIFDYNMIRGTFNILLSNIRDTMITERLLTSGYMGLKSLVGLDHIAYRYLGVELDKTFQTSFPTHTGPFFAQQIKYAADDVAYLHPILNKQRIKIRNLGLERVAKLECEIISVFADIEWFGMLVDKDMVKKNIERWELERKQILNEMKVHLKKIVGVNMFGEMAYSPSSQPTTMLVLNSLGIRNADGDPLEDSAKDTLIPHAHKHPFIMQLLRFRKVEKSLSTYGYPMLEKIHPLTGRLHPHVNQLGTKTGRPTSKDPNMLNVPRDNAIRNCIYAPDGWMFIDDDYSGCELRIIGDKSRDPKYVQGFLGGVDFHCYTASELFRVGVTKKNENKKLRTPAKGLNFGLSYGMGPSKLYVKLNNEGYPIGMEDCVVLYKKYKEETYPEACAYLKRRGEDAIRDGYIATRYGRRRFFDVPSKPPYECFELAKKYRYDTDEKPSEKEQKLIDKAEKWREQVGAIQREGANMDIQGGNVDITKMAMLLMKQKLKGRGFKAHCANMVYDELITEAPDNEVEEMSVIQKECMLEAEKMFLDVVPPEVDCGISKRWVKD